MNNDSVPHVEIDGGGNAALIVDTSNNRIARWHNPGPSTFEVRTMSGPAIKLGGSFYNTDIFIGRVPVLKTLAALTLLSLALAITAPLL